MQIVIKPLGSTPDPEESLAVRAAGAAVAVAVASRTPFAGDAGTRRSFLASLSEADFLKTLTVCNAQLRGRQTAGHTMDGQNVSAPDLRPPAFKDRAALLGETLATAQSFARDASLSDEVALRKAALTLAGGINLIHAFANGSGRSARLISYLVDQGLDGTATSTQKAIDAAISSRAWFTSPMCNDVVQNVANERRIAAISDEHDLRPAGIDNDIAGMYRTEDFVRGETVPQDLARKVAVGLNERSGWVPLYETLAVAGRLNDSTLVSDDSYPVGKTLRIKAVAAVAQLDETHVRSFVDRLDELVADKVRLFLAEMVQPTFKYQELRTVGTVPELYEHALVTSSRLLKTQEIAPALS